MTESLCNDMAAGPRSPMVPVPPAPAGLGGDAMLLKLLIDGSDGVSVLLAFGLELLDDAGEFGASEAIAILQPVEFGGAAPTARSPPPLTRARSIPTCRIAAIA